MILSESLFSALPWVLLLAFVALPLVWRFMPDAKMNHWKRLGFVVGMVACWAAWASIQHAGSSILIVKIRSLGARAETTRGRLFFSTTYTFLDGHQTKLGQLAADNFEGTIIVNDSSTPMRLDMITYTSNSRVTLANHTTPVPEWSVVDWDTAVDDVGPDQPAPSGMSSPIGLTARAWLTWGRTSDSRISFVEPRYGTKEWDAGTEDAGGAR